MKILRKNYLFICVVFFFSITGVLSSRPIGHRNVRQTKREVGQISREKCEEYSQISEDLVPPTLSLLHTKIKVNACRSEGNTLIIGGEKAKPTEFPHMAILRFGNESNFKYLCAGSLISERYILTAAHCLSARKLGNCSRIRLGDLNVNDTMDDSSPDDFAVQELIAHPDYKYPSQYNDIALIKIDRDVFFNRYIRPACIYNKEELPERAVATGWGLTSPRGNLSDDLLKVTLDLFDQPSCNASYEYKISERRLKYGIVGDTQICAGSKSDKAKDTCQGDSGGPLQIYHPTRGCVHMVLGVTSIGDSCGVLPGVYTRVSKYLEWIENTVWPQ